MLTMRFSVGCCGRLALVLSLPSMYVERLTKERKPDRARSSISLKV